MEIKVESGNKAASVLAPVLQVGSFVEFDGRTRKMYGCICRVNNDNTVSYIRESLTRWTVEAPMMAKGRNITEDDFISRVKLNAKNSGEKIPSTEEVRAALEIFKSNFDARPIEIHRALNMAKVTERRIVTQDWYETEFSKTGWASHGWRFDDGKEMGPGWTIDEQIDIDKFGNPLLAVAEREVNV